MKGLGFEQISLFDELLDGLQEEEIKEYEPLGKIYGKGIKIYPHIPSKTGSKYLQYLDPLESYDKILVAFSGGKDSVCAVLYLLDIGVPKEKIILLHHNIDGEGNNSILEMDWSCTRDYCKKFAKSLGLAIKFSWREKGLAGELFRYGASAPIYFEELENSTVVKTVGANWAKSEKLKQEIKYSEEGKDTKSLREQLKKLGYRFKFPAKSASLKTRWCSSSLKIEVCDRMLRYSQTTTRNIRCLVVTGERREESSNRNLYNEIELHTTHAPTKGRIVHAWRNVIDMPEQMVWDMLKKYRVKPHPVYYAGFSRCSCAFCIFSMPYHLAGARKLMPEKFDRLVEIEKQLGFTFDSKKDLISYVGNAIPCVPEDLEDEILDIIKNGIVPKNYVLLKDNEEWKLPIGAFKGSCGGAS